MTAIKYFLLFCLVSNNLLLLWKKTFKTIHQLSYFVGHPIIDEESGLPHELCGCIKTKEFLLIFFTITIFMDFIITLFR